MRVLIEDPPLFSHNAAFGSSNTLDFMKKTYVRSPQNAIPVGYAEVKEHVKAFITQLESRENSRFAKLRIRASDTEFFTIDGASGSRSQKKNFAITIEFRKPCLPAKTKPGFKELIEWMKTAGYRYLFFPGELNSAGKTAHYKLGFIQEAEHDPPGRLKPDQHPLSGKHIRWSGDCWAVTDTKTAEIHKEKGGNGEGTYAVTVYSPDSAVLHESKAKTLAEAQEIVKIQLAG